MKNARILLASSFALSIALAGGPAFAGGTAPGTVIQNTATASYQDGSGNSYTTNSNTVSTTVQNAPSLTVSAGTGSTYAAGAQVSDSFTLTNTGNANGSFNLTGGTNGVATPGGALNVSYSVGANTFATIAALQTYLTANPVAPGSSTTIGVTYTIPTGTAAGTSLPTTLTATITQAAVGAVPAATSTAQSATETDSVVADARLDLQKCGVQPGAAAAAPCPANATANILYQITANNGGGLPAKDLASVKTLLGVANPGIFISDFIPQFGGTPLTISNVAVATNAANGYLGTATQIYTSTTGATGSWVAYTGPGNAPAGSKYVGVYITGGANGNELASKPGSSGGNVPTAALTLTFQAVPPTGAGSGNTNAVVNQADGVIGGDQGAPGTVGNNVVGPGIPANTTDSVAAITNAGQGINYPTPATPGASTANGASNSVGNNAPLVGGVLNGPFGNPGATGSYNGVVANNNANDFTAVAFNPLTFVPTNSGTVPGTPNGNSLTATTTVNASSSFQNTGNATDNFTVAIVPPAGWTAQIFASDGAGNPTGTTLSGAASATPSATFANVAANATVNYVVVYTAPTGTQAFKPYDSTSTATSSATGNPSNTTHHELVLGGPIYLTKQQALDPATCPGGLAVPGCKITYTVNYNNNAAPAASCGTTLSSVAASLSGYLAKGLSITEDGTAGGNTWATNTNGLVAPAVDTTTGTTFTTNTAASTKFTAAIGGAGYTINPGCSGSLSFSVVIK